MSRLIEGLVAGGVLAGVVWYARRDRQKAGAEVDTAERLARLAVARAQLATAIEQADGAVAAGNSAAATHARSTTLSPPPPRPISSPVVTVRPPPAPLRPAAGLTRRFDDLFRLHGRGIPVAYLRALANAESGMNPDHRLGLINVVPTALADYNARHPNASITAAELREPAKNIAVAAAVLRTIIDSYQRYHRNIPNLVEDWGNPRFAELLTAGWNSGYSELAGVGRVVSFLKTRGIVRPADITLDTVFDAAWSAGAASHLSNPKKRDFAKNVAAAYVRELERDTRDGITRPTS
jgi:hypothetical protein